MSSFLKGKKLWRVITGDIVKPVKEETETQVKLDVMIGIAKIINLLLGFATHLSPLLVFNLAGSKMETNQLKPLGIS